MRQSAMSATGQLESMLVRAMKTAGAALLLIFGSLGLARAESREQTFEFYPPGDTARVNPAKLVLMGEILSPAVQYFPTVTGTRPDVLLDFLTRLSAASREGKPADHLALWSPGEREAMRPTITRLFESNQALARTITRSSLRARLLYGPYVLAVVRHELKDGTTLVSVYPVVREGESDFLTDRLASDPIFGILMTTLRERFK
jgi:hypothetical protein